MKIQVHYKPYEKACPLCGVKRCEKVVCRDILSKNGYYEGKEFKVTDTGIRKYKLINKKK